ELAHQILAINGFQDLPSGLSVNVVQAGGGTRSNVIPDEARATVDVRVPTAAAGVALEARFRALRPTDPRTTVQAVGGIDRPPLERTAGVARLYQCARALAGELGQPLEEGGAGARSDRNFTPALAVH